jgi:polyhydroxyalkanoate synthase
VSAAQARPKLFGQRTNGAGRFVCDDPVMASPGSTASVDGDKRTASPPAEDERTIDNVLGQQVMGDFRPSDLVDTAGTVVRGAIMQPGAVARSSLGFLAELGLLVAGEDRLEPEPGDRRFKDEAWSDSAVYSSVLQSYLALCRSLERYAQRASDDPRQSERIRFLMSQIADAVAPTNFLLGNPVALRTARESRGISLLKGARNLVGDLVKRRPIPTQVDSSAFEVGGNLAVTPGHVVLRTEMFELIQYAPQTPQVHALPVVIVPSIVNKFYVFDLAPGRSVVEYFVRAGLTVFMIAWRNPQPRHDRWGMPEYQDAIEAAIDAATSIRRVRKVNLWAVCGAGPVAVSLAGYYAARRRRRINSLLLFVAPLDTKAMSDAPNIGAFIDKDSPAAPKPVMRELQTRRISARDFTLLFAMLRANDLIWNYWVSNYLLGKTPSAFDVLYWNADATGMTAQFNHDFSEFVDDNPLVTPGAMRVRGTPIAEISKLGFDSYVIGARNDHLCIWQSVYRTAQLLSPRSQFILGNSGHIQTIVCPPGHRKASFSTNPDLSGTADEWLAGSERHEGSWWEHGAAWSTERSGALVDAPASPGSDEFPVLGEAPGTYVHERA